MVSQLWSWRAPRRDVSSADPRSIGPAATRCGRAAACQQRLEASSCGPPQQLAQTLHLDHVVAVEVAHLLADDPVHKYLHPCLLLRGIQARQREARAFVKRRGPLGALFGHADVEGLLREKRRGFGAVGKGASGHRARGQPGAWRKGGERGRASVGSGILQLSHKTRGDVVLEREGRARPTLRLPARPLWCTARCLRQTPLRRRYRPDNPVADPSAGAPGAVRHRGQKGDFRPDSPSPTGRAGCSPRYARVDQRLFSTRVSPAQRAVHHSPRTKRRPEALTQSASPNSQDASQATLVTFVSSFQIYPYRQP